ncbi:MAG: b-xylosidase/arabinofuranosidase, Glycoside Hydrolase Family 43-like protein [Sphingobacteriales bacterium]|nr:b-xylosidase/arabinofuranosidase, Glycoside Hydrolase Family 43-like protein [Sphingobacteriales bacterium]
MTKKSAFSTNSAIHLFSPKHSPFQFDITIKQLAAGYEFTVSTHDAVTRKVKTCSYILKDKQHQSYLNFYKKLADDFSLTIPKNRQHLLSEPSFKVDYQQVLTKNLMPEILYGYGDPAIILVDEGQETCYYLVVTSNDAPNSFPIIRSKNLIDWESAGFVFPKGKKPKWAIDGELISDFWAAEMHQVGNEFRVYFVARDKHTKELCIGKAVSNQPKGPFIADPEPLLRGNVIDPHIYVDDDETTFLYWKEDNNDVWPSLLINLLHNHPKLITPLFTEVQDQLTASLTQTLWPWLKELEPMERFLAQQLFIETVTANYSAFYKKLETLRTHQSSNVQEDIDLILKFMKTPMYAQQLSSDGSQLINERIKIIENDLDWEAHLVEGMWVTKQLDNYYLFYAGNDFSTNEYGIGVAISKSATGPYKKMTQPFLQSSKDWWAPGHPSVVIAPDGKPTMFLHAFYPGQAGYKKFRALLSLPLVFTNESVYFES